MDSTEKRSDDLFSIREPDRDPDRPQAPPWQMYKDQVTSAWFALLARSPEEREVQEFLELHPALIPGGSGDIGPGGHHGSQMSFVFREPELKGVGSTYKPDFMWVTWSSGSITPILIEIEDPGKRWFNQNGRPSANFTQAHDQLNDWRAWFGRDGNTAAFRQRYLFADDRSNRQIVPHFLLIYGRETEFERGGGHRNPDEIRNKREGLRHVDESFRTFDSLLPRYDHGSSITVTMTASGPRAHAFSPVFGTSADDEVGKAAELLGDATEALSRSVWMSPERKSYLAGRWDHWRTARHAQKQTNRIEGFQGGLE